MASSRKAGGRGSQTALPPLTVRYMRRMKRQKVYAYEVSWNGSGKGRGPSAGPIVVRLIVGGAQVVPSERTLDPEKPDARANFYVTPLASGWLRGERLEVLQGGQKVQEIALPSKVVSQRMTWVLLALTFLVPWLVHTYIEGDKDRRPYPGDAFAQTIHQNAPPPAAFIKDNAPGVADKMLEYSESPKWAINYLHFLSQNQGVPLAYYTAAGFLVLTLLSWFLHRDKRKRRVGKPIPLPEREDEEDEEDERATRRRGQAAEVEVG